MTMTCVQKTVNHRTSNVFFAIADMYGVVIAEIQLSLESQMGILTHDHCEVHLHDEHVLSVF